MEIVKRGIAIIATILGFTFVVNAQTFESKTLKEMAGKIHLTVPDSLMVPGYHDCGTYKGKTLTIGVDSEGTVHHLGYKLFMPDMRTLYPSEVYDFLERYTLELTMTDDLYFVEQKQKDDKFYFANGSLYDMKKVTPDVPFNIQRTENAFYTVTWNPGGSDEICVQFPIQYELLLGMPKNEIEKKVNKHVKLCENAEFKFEVPQISNTQILHDSIHKTMPNDFYQLKEVTDASYYILKDDRLNPVFSKEYPEYTAANLFLTDVAKGGNYRIYIEQSLYGGVKEHFTIELLDLLKYCQTNKMKIYFAVEEVREDGMKAILIIQNINLGYNHMMSLTIPDTFIQNRNTVLKAVFNAFIPTQNVKNLYGQYKSRPKKKI